MNILELMTKVTIEFLNSTNFLWYLIGGFVGSTVGGILIYFNMKPKKNKVIEQEKEIEKEEMDILTIDDIDHILSIVNGNINSFIKYYNDNYYFCNYGMILKLDFDINDLQKDDYFNERYNLIKYRSTYYVLIKSEINYKQYLFSLRVDHGSNGNSFFKILKKYIVE